MSTEVSTKVMPIMNPWQEEKALDKKGDEGVRVCYAPGIWLTIGAMSAPRYQKVFEAAQKVIRREYGKRKVPDAVAEDAFCTCLAEGVLFGWDNGTKEAKGEAVFPGPDGSPVPFDIDAAAQALKMLKRFRNFVALFAADDENFAEDVEELQTKN